LTGTSKPLPLKNKALQKKVTKAKKTSEARKEQRRLKKIAEWEAKATKTPVSYAIDAANAEQR